MGTGPSPPYLSQELHVLRKFHVITGEGGRRLIGIGSLGLGQVIRKLKQNEIRFAPYLMLWVDFESPVDGGV